MTSMAALWVGLGVLAVMFGEKKAEGQTECARLKLKLKVRL